MEKLELKHLAPYLPYGLKIEHPTFLIGKRAVSELNSIGQGIIEVSHRFYVEISSCKPILRQLSDLTKEIEVNGEKFVPYKWIKDNYLSYNIYGYRWFKNKTNLANIQILPFDVMHKLLEWNFDIFGLIEKGLAIDKNTLEL